VPSPAVDLPPRSGGAQLPRGGPGPASAAGDGARRWPWWLGLAAVLAVALGLRLWGLRHGLPYAYNTDENAHYVPTAIGLFGHDGNPHYFVNPPAFTYLLHAVFAIWFGGREAASDAFALDPAEVFTVARATAAAVGVGSVWLLYVAGARLAGRAVGLLAAALLAVSFLPVFYSHLALNDVPTLAPIALSLAGAAGVLRRERRVDFALAGAGLGIACATKYTGGIVLLCLLGAVAARLSDPAARRAALAGLPVAAVCALGAFVVANPFAVLAFDEFWDGVSHQQSASGDAAGKLGLSEELGLRYYLWTATWGLGWAPLAAAGAGAVWTAVRDRGAALVLLPALAGYLAFMGTQERFFGRWLLPVFPLLCLLAAVAGVQAARWAARRARVPVAAAGALVAVALLAQGVVSSVHVGRVLSETDTRNLARAWLVAHAPVRTKMVVEPGVVPDSWAFDVGRSLPQTSTGQRWIKFPTSRENRAPDGSIEPGAGAVINLENYERTLTPALVDLYERDGWCYVVSGSTQRGRAEAEPAEVPGAIAYYRELDRRSVVAFRTSPYHRGAGPVPFNFDWSFDFYPRAYARPGPEITIHRLTGGRCARS
jgi:hypothetical protein